MILYNNCATIIVAVLFFFVSYSDSKDLVNDAKDTLTSAASNVADALIPNCIFGVKSVSYILYTRSNPGGVKVQQEDKRIPLHPGVSVAILIHGFVSEANSSNFYSLTKNWLQSEDINIFSVNWDDAACANGLSLTDALAYGSAVKNVPAIGKDVAKFSQRLAQNFGVQIRQIRLIGHSLGAHVAGHAGKAIQQMMNQKYGEIVGLDPAGPKFRNKKCPERLCVSDAAYVQACHTSLTFGYHQPIGHADFYFHGGTRQPGCFLANCDHSKSVYYASIFVQRPSCYLGTRWQLDSRKILSTRQCNPAMCSHAGLSAPVEKAQGVYYVAPSSSKPHCTM